MLYQLLLTSDWDVNSGQTRENTQCVLRESEERLRAHLLYACVWCAVEQETDFQKNRLDLG